MTGRVLPAYRSIAHCPICLELKRDLSEPSERTCWAHYPLMLIAKTDPRSAGKIQEIDFLVTRDGKPWLPVEVKLV